LIDEGQDCLDEQVRLFRSLAPVCYVAADHKQSIYRGVDGLKMWQQVINKENWSNLQFHYRNGKSICELADLVSIPADPANLLVPSMRYKEADLPSKVFAQPADSLDKQIDNLLTLLKQQLIAYPDEMLGVICPTHTVMQKVVPRLRSSGLTELCVFQRDVDGESYMRFSDQKRICVTTCHSAKGLEVRALHIVGADQFVAHPLRRNLVYTSITRAKTSLTIHYTNTLPDFLESALNQQNSGSTRQVDVKDLFGKENVD
ncbi:MAG: ATP-binding domain-containing protein, partial [Cyanobacteria bacterium HKST-UBA02]|nr:ATP-binding domain-containing protein [Cyanobacteria bacterium HKST-UBA02]